MESIFRSRWVDVPERAREGYPCALPRGFAAAGVHAGIKSSGLDLGMIAATTERSVSAARFTRNAWVGAPVELNLKEGSLDVLRAVVVNSGNANVGNGDRGMTAARSMRDAAAGALGLHAHMVGVASTGVIGKHLDADLAAESAKVAAGSLTADGGDAFSRSILTTDRGPKRGSLVVECSGGSVTVSCQAKGAGMIAPNLSSATTLVFLETDAVLPDGAIGSLLDEALGSSLDRISVDGEMSTSDSVFAMASGAGVAVRNADDMRLVEGAFTALLLGVSMEIVADGEGSTTTSRLTVTGAHNREEAECVAYAVAGSPLVKTAIYGNDPNWGRIVSAAGAAIGRRSAHREWLNATLAIEGVELCSRGESVDLSTADRERVGGAMAGIELDIELDLARGSAQSTIYFSDLGHEYVDINTRYT